ncbi:thioredoxin reductase (NADPH) [Breznakia sp. PF5-3]|uniref:thioredoxin-disulfide reductase n=1 Tax=unclassified Breznakia TaxID=2623764 RepID=UPI002405B1E3|nr:MULTISPECIES: thioredoxin-disulfide reductase [unclassified Breznakia]MDF9825213.1 thioredoxin reductase (NADPH) [Breznakia sp. PM6-1]MDF9836094.1 thioredoxin reductase (NADPH) [Breznakia sp. PF5-3]MDF9838660.1 thioredoxin reductase (NADPH) [Breznakia sp. PFB2-8]MDF9860691.1 thioredoxin reductase (NADPH) [Breznakia sp. PH5-24]
MERISDLIIIGAGPAGMSAAIYASRAGLKTIMLEAGAPGGKLTKTDKIENWPGVNSMNGFELANKMFIHSTSFGAEYMFGNVVRIEKSKEDGDYHRVICDDGNVYAAKAVIVATGTQEQLLNVKGEKENIGRGVSFCAVCDGAFFKDKDIAVIGGGNAALEEALYLAEFASKVYIIIRRDVFRADQIVVDKIINNSKIEVIRERLVSEIVDDGMKVTGVKLKSKDGNETDLAVSAVFPYIGAVPTTGFLKGVGITDEKGYMIVNENMETSIAGIYGAGDVTAKNLRQVVTATNDGAIAAQSVIKQIKSL